jgi:plastocyanin
MLLLPACETPALIDRGAELDLEQGTIRLPPGVRIIEIRVSATGGRNRIVPDSVLASTGDVIRFVAGDALTHAMVFDDTHLTTGQRTFLETTGQLRGPPLLTSGATWVVSLEDAPAGRYPYLCATHGGRGVIIVSE